LCSDEVGIRPGEKLHEEMITVSDAINTYDIGKYYAILPGNNHIDSKEKLLNILMQN
jgi:UDP-N-acetylglucosamine 4,6-dehydratase